MSTVGLIVRGVIALAIIAAIYAVVHTVDSALENHYVAPVRAEYEAKLKSANERAEAAEAANSALQAQIAGVKKQVDACNLRVDELKAEGQKRTNISNKRLADQEKSAKAVYDDMIDRLAKAAKTSTPGGFCDQAKKADETLDGIGDRQRVRDAARKAGAGG